MNGNHILRIRTLERENRILRELLSELDQETRMLRSVANDDRQDGNNSIVMTIGTATRFRN